MGKIERIKELVELLNHYRNEYYNNSRSEISDFEYDQLFDELSQLEIETGFIMAVSPTQTDGFDVVSELEKIADMDEVQYDEYTGRIKDYIYKKLSYEKLKNNYKVLIRKITDTNKINSIF